MVASVSSGTPWETELEQLTVQMQMLSHHLIIAPIIKFEKYHNSRSVLRTQSMTHTGRFLFPVLSSPSLAEVREAAGKSSLSLISPLPSMSDYLCFHSQQVLLECNDISSQPISPTKGGLPIAQKFKPPISVVTVIL